jgi:hypothetical protein
VGMCCDREGFRAPDGMRSTEICTSPCLQSMARGGEVGKHNQERGGIKKEIMRSVQVKAAKSQVSALEFFYRENNKTTKTTCACECRKKPPSSATIRSLDALGSVF